MQHQDHEPSSEEETPCTSPRPLIASPTAKDAQKAAQVDEEKTEQGVLSKETAKAKASAQLCPGGAVHERYKDEIDPKTRVEIGLLIESSFIGPIIGKKGSVINEIRKKSGVSSIRFGDLDIWNQETCHRVLSLVGDHPGCARAIAEIAGILTQTRSGRKNRQSENTKPQKDAFYMLNFLCPERYCGMFIGKKGDRIKFLRGTGEGDGRVSIQIAQNGTILPGDAKFRRVFGAKVYGRNQQTFNVAVERVCATLGMISHKMATAERERAQEVGPRALIPRAQHLDFDPRAQKRGGVQSIFLSPMRNPQPHPYPPHQQQNQGPLTQWTYDQYGRLVHQWQPPHPQQQRFPGFGMPQHAAPYQGGYRQQGGFRGRGGGRGRNRAFYNQRKMAVSEHEAGVEERITQLTL